MKYKYINGSYSVNKTAKPTKADYTKTRAVRNQQNNVNSLVDVAGSQFGKTGLGGVGSTLGSSIKGDGLNTTNSAVGTSLSYGAQGADIGANFGPYGIAIGTGVGLIGGAVKGVVDAKSLQTYKKQADDNFAYDKSQEKNEVKDPYQVTMTNKRIGTQDTGLFAKKGKAKLKGKVIETEGREPIFSEKDKNGKRKLLYHNPKDPNHSKGGVKMLVVPKNYKFKNLGKVQSPKKPKGISSDFGKTLTKFAAGVKKLSNGQKEGKAGYIDYTSSPVVDLQPDLKAFEQNKKIVKPYKKGTKNLTTSSYKKGCKYKYKGGGAALKSGGFGKGLGSKLKGLGGNMTDEFGNVLNSEEFGSQGGMPSFGGIGEAVGLLTSFLPQPKDGLAKNGKKVLTIPAGSAIVTANKGMNKLALKAYKKKDFKALNKIIDKMPKDK